MIEKQLEDLQKAFALERQRLNILKNQIDYIIKELNKLKFKIGEIK